MLRRFIRAVFAPVGKLFGEPGRSRTGALRPPVAIALSILVIAGSAISLYLTYRPARPRVDLKRHAALGEVLAEETAQLLGGKGDIVLVTFDNGGMANPATETQLRAFNQKLQKLGGITVLATERIHPTEAMAILLPEMALPGARYRELVAQYARADAIVSFIGLPFLKNEDLAGLPEKLPQFIAVSGPAFGSRELKRLFDGKIVQVAIVPRMVPAPSPATESKTTRGLFDQHFQVVTAETFSQMPDRGDPVAPGVVHAPPSETATEK